ncbi:hypothetical protein [Microbacterium sp. NPDC089696]
MTPLDFILWAIAAVIAVAAVLAVSIGIYLIVTVIRRTVGKGNRSGGAS